MAEYTATAPQTVAVNSNVIFTDTIKKCNKYVIHRPDSGLFILKGCGNSCFTEFEISLFTDVGNTVENTAVIINATIDGEPINSARISAVPAAITDLWTVGRVFRILVPKGCCATVAFRNISPNPIRLANADLVIEPEV